MLRAGVPPSIRRRAWVVMSAALSWAARSQVVPEIQSNGCLLAGERTTSRRRSVRRGGTGYAPATRRRPLARWALSPRAVEVIREQMLLRVDHRDPLLAHRDAMIVSLQYGLGARSQEVWALRWTSIIGSFAWLTEVLTDGRVEEWGKTESSTNRRTLLPGILLEDLTQWRTLLASRGHRIANVDFVVPGNLAGVRYGVRECLPLRRRAGKDVASAVLHTSGAECSRRPWASGHPRSHALLATPRRHLASPAHGGPADCRTRVRHERTDAQQSLCVCNRGSATPRATASRRRVARGARRPSQAARRRARTLY
jgi:integrase